METQGCKHIYFPVPSKENFLGAYTQVYPCIVWHLLPFFTLFWWARTLHKYISVDAVLSFFSCRHISLTVTVCSLQSGGQDGRSWASRQRCDLCGGTCERFHRESPFSKVLGFVLGCLSTMNWNKCVRYSNLHTGVGSCRKNVVIVVCFVLLPS